MNKNVAKLGKNDQRFYGGCPRILLNPGNPMKKCRNEREPNVRITFSMDGIVRTLQKNNIGEGREEEVGAP
ncbi:MAG: hypothetical protein RBG13Loki_0349 [Promethearchaeota archaeon CR_4]|nr:MAG: hypothetical protein RBG13Loki_0349 [Candidatus Lokiarchaeota archaeon CR_4]